MLQEPRLRVTKTVDGTAAAVRRALPAVRVVELPRNRGAAAFDAHPRMGLLAARILVGSENVLDPICEQMGRSVWAVNRICRDRRCWDSWPARQWSAAALAVLPRLPAALRARRRTSDAVGKNLNRLHSSESYDGIVVYGTRRRGM